MPHYEHLCNSCGHQWEEEYSIKQDPPKVCPSCQQESVKRLISMGGKGVVELYGQDLVDKVKADAKQIQRDAARDEKQYANLLGPDRYQKLQTQMDKRRR